MYRANFESSRERERAEQEQFNRNIGGGKATLSGTPGFSCCWVAVAGEGARYTVHTDNDCHNGDGEGCNGRRLTTILYLNPAWSSCHGGQLRTYTDETRENSIDVAPVMGRLSCSVRLEGTT